MGKLADYNINEIAGALSLTLGSIGGLCLILFKSRCEKISICWGVWSCNRKVLTEEEMQAQAKQAKDLKDLKKVNQANIADRTRSKSIARESEDIEEDREEVVSPPNP